MPWNVSTRPSRKGVDVNGAKLRHVADGDQRTPAIPACGNPSGKCSDVERAATDDRIVVFADTDFGALLAARTVQKPSVIQFRGPGSRKPDALVRTLLSNLAQFQTLQIVRETERLRSPMTRRMGSPAS